MFQVLAIAAALAQTGARSVCIAGASPGQEETLARHLQAQGYAGRIVRSGRAHRPDGLLLPRLAWHALRVVAAHILRRRPAPPAARTCLFTYVDRGFSDGTDAFFGPLASRLAERSGEMPLHLALIQAPWREMLPRLESASTFRYWPLFHELTLADVGAAFAATLGAARRIEGESRAAGRIEGIDAAPLLAEALAWDLGPGGYFLNQLVRHASRRFAARTQPQRLIYPFEMKSLEKMLLLGVREGAPQCRLTGYQHTSITPRHTTFLLTRAECAVTPLPDRVVTVGDVTREYLEACGHYPAGLFRTGGALRQAPREPLPPASLEGRPLRLLLALSSSRRELAEAVAMLRALQERRSDIEVGVRPHPEFPLALLPANLREAVGTGMRNLSSTPLADNLDWCDAVVYVSSTVALEALLAGRPVITLRLSDVIDPDPLLGDPPLRQHAASLAELEAACERVRSAAEPAARAAAADYVRRYLRPFDAAALDAFL